MKINIENPSISSGIGIAIIFTISMIILILTKPEYIMEVNDDGLYKINYFLLISHSLLYGIAVGIIVLLLTARDQKTTPVETTIQHSFTTQTPPIYRTK